MEFIDSILQNKWFERILWSAVVILISLLTYHLIARFLKNKEAKNSRILSEKKNKTFLRMLRSIIAYVLFILTALVILQIFGVNVSSMLAGVGIASIIVSFALQDALKDIVRGFEIISDGYYSLGLRTTRIQDLNTMNMMSIANRNIDQIAIVSNQVYLTVPVPYELDLNMAETIMKEITAKLKITKNITGAEYQGITDFAPSSLNFQIMITCDPSLYLSTRRAALGVIKETLDKHKVSIPYNQVGIHLGGFKPKNANSKVPEMKRQTVIAKRAGSHKF